MARVQIDEGKAAPPRWRRRAGVKRNILKAGEKEEKLGGGAGGRRCRGEEVQGV